MTEEKEEMLEIVPRYRKERRRVGGKRSTSGH